MALLRLILLALLVLTVVYISVSLWSRAVRREKLQKEWIERGSHGDRDAFVREGLVEYDRSFRKRLIWSIYVIPAVLFAAVVYFVNYA